MYRLSLAQANSMIAGALSKAADEGLRPLTVVVHDPGGNLIACQRADGSSPVAAKFAGGKACGALALGQSSRKIAEMSEGRPHFVPMLEGMAPGGVVPVAGGVIACDAEGVIVGAIGVTGETPENDEACALAGIAAVGLQPKN